MRRTELCAVLATTALFSMAGGFLASLLAGAPRASAAEEKRIGDGDTIVEAREVRLVSGGQLRALLSTDDKGAVSLALCDAKSAPRLLLAANPDGSALLVARDEAGAARVSFGLSDKDTCALIFNNAGNRKAAAITASAGSPSSLSLFDGDGKARAITAVAADGRPMILLSDRERLRLQVSCMSDGSPGIILFDGKGEQGWGVTDRTKR